MAGGKSIISTPVYDVVRDYDKHIEIVENAEQFTIAINKLICQHKASNNLKYREILDRTSWDNTVSEMHDLMKQLVEKSVYA